MKTCNTCSKAKPLDDFHRDSARTDGRKSQCKACNLAASRKHRLTCATCGRALYASQGSRPQGEATCHACRRDRNPGKPPVPKKACTRCRRLHRGKYPECYECRHPSGWNGPTLSGDSAADRAEQARERRKWKPVVDAGRAFCQQGLPGNGSSGTCVFPSRWIAPGAKWAVGHTDDRSRRIGPVHHRCNHLDACSRGGAAKKAKYGTARGRPAGQRTPRTLAL